MKAPYSSWSSISDYLPNKGKYLKGGESASTAVIVIAVILIILLFISIIVTASWGSIPERGSRLNTLKSGQVTELKTAEEVEAALAGKSPVMVLVEMKGCGFCERAKPILQELSKEHKNVKFVKISGENASDLLRKHEITGFPTWLTNFTDEKKMIGFKPKDEMQKLVKAAKNFKPNKGARLVVSPTRATTDAPPAVGALEVTADEARALLEDKQHPVAVLVSQDWCGFCKQLMPIYDELATELTNAKFVKVNGGKAEAFVVENNITGFPTILRNYGPTTVVVGYKPKAELAEVLRGEK